MNHDLLRPRRHLLVTSHRKGLRCKSLNFNRSYPRRGGTFDRPVKREPLGQQLVKGRVVTGLGTLTDPLEWRGRMISEPESPRV